MREKFKKLLNAIKKGLNFLFDETFNSRVFNILVTIFVPTLMFILINISTWLGFILFILITLGLTYIYNIMHTKLDNDFVNKIFRLLFGFQFFMYSIGIILGFLTTTQTHLGSLSEFVLISFVMLGLIYLPELINRFTGRVNKVSYRIYFYAMLAFIIAVATFYELQSFLGFSQEYEFYNLVNYAYLMITIDVVIDLFKGKWQEKNKKPIKNEISSNKEK
jgi:hypothetical protein